MDSHQILNVPEFGVRDAYDALLGMRGYKADAAQLRAISRLQQLYSELLSFKAQRRTTLRKLFIHPDLPRSVFMWGGVGRGKSFIMDCFFDAVPYKRKRRVHFHAFMHEMHAQLRAHQNEDDPLARVAEDIAKQTRLLCFDEFHVSDIADAMILGRLLQALFERGVVFVMTSNYPPDGLYPNGLQRQNFLPTIALIKQQFDVVEVDDGTDYRLRSLESMNIFITPADEAAQRELAGHFGKMAGTPGSPGEITVLERKLPVRRVAPGVVWFDFATLCGGPRSQNDYLDIAREYHTVLLSNVPVMTREQGNEARRFTWLIDVLYEARVKLIVSAATEAAELYREGPNAQEFPRTVSRLIEMRSREYLAEPHRAG
ncbi:cell division protein ZapE [Uliginosibacterium aquaticum]|uniref:Cell division protein ZapE n=1 Tax=Uliginosibacterium aquaticum TaxID=2731212 RepID=A0ABX2IDH0_9RHOO|nr:cell division protein ZapE [Uliginosibacterium aquaticum]NSL54483.1 cell division protein ZapE [Uliginosibacterium aquaticum]